VRKIGILLLIFILCSCNEQKKKSNSILSISEIVKGIELKNRVEAQSIGIANKPSKQWNKYEQLEKTATEEQLIALTDHKNSVVRCYAFQALAARNSSCVFNVLLKHLHDTTTVSTLNGDMGCDMYVGDYFIEVVTPDFISNKLYKLSKKERETLDSILIYDKSVCLYGKMTVLKVIKPTKGNYAIIKELVEKDRNANALTALAKYHKRSDKMLISSFLKDEKTTNYALLAIIEFPDDFFYPFVKRILLNEWVPKDGGYDSNRLILCYEILAKYPRAETIELFEKTIKIKDKSRYNNLCEFLLIAISKYPNKLYEPLKQKIKVDEGIMNSVKDYLEYDI
jgi:hypothetical protein